MSRTSENVTFFSDGLKIAALLYMPDLDDPCPGIVIPQGTVGLKEHYRTPQICEMLADAGFAALTFDYRGFGQSEGPPARIVPEAQIRDIRNAITYISAHQSVDPDRVGLLGFCWGGSHAIYAAAIDPRIRCVVEVGGVGNGFRWLRSLRRRWEWYEFLDRIDADRKRRVLEGSPSETVRFGEILIGSPKAKEGRKRIIAEIAPDDPPYVTPDATLQTAELIMEYKPEEIVSRISPHPLLIMHGAADDVTPVEEAEALFEAAREPKEFVVFAGAYHHEVYLDPLFWDVMEHALKWFRDWLC